MKQLTVKGRRNMTSDEIEKIENSLYDIANKIVGNVGKSTTNHLSVTSESYITVAIRLKDKSQILSCWENWITAYKEFVRHKKDECAPIDKRNPLTIYWRTLPKITEDPNQLGQFVLYARLLISAASEDLCLLRE